MAHNTNEMNNLKLRILLGIIAAVLGVISFLILPLEQKETTKTVPVHGSFASRVRYASIFTDLLDQSENPRRDMNASIKEYSDSLLSYNNVTEENEEESMEASDRYVYQEGFYYQSITDDIKERINGLSYKEDCTVPYEDLRQVSVLYVDFSGETKQGEIICNKAIAQDLVEIFYELYCNEYQIDKIRLIDEYDADDDLSCADNNTSCFNFRTVYGSGNLSKHALGLAIDINPFQNPYVTYPNGVERISPPGSEPYADRNSGLPHMITEEDLCYRLFRQHGFTWGGHWNTMKDYQHFQKEI